MKKLFTLFALLMAIVVGARAVEVKTATLVTPDATCTSLTDADGIVTITGNGKDKVQTGNNMNGFTDKAMKLSGNTDFTLSYKSGVTILKVNLYAVSNKDAETCTIGLGGEGKDNSSLGTVPNRKSDPLVIDFTNNNTFRLSAQSNVIIEVKYVTEALPTDRATIIEQPKGGKYVLNSTEDVTMSVDAYVTPGNTATYKWWLEDEKENTLDLSLISAAGSTNTIKLSSFLDIPVTNENYIGQNYYFYCEITSSGNTVTTEKAKVQFLGPAVDAPTFSIAAGSTIKVGQKFAVTAPEGTVIYSNWSSSQGKYTAESLMTRTPTEGNTTEVYTTTLGTRYYSAIAVKEGYAPSAVAEVKLIVEALKFKGELDKTSDAVVKDAAAPALPVLTLKDDAGTEFSKPGFITATYALAEGSTPGIITLNADGTGIESISTATAGTATVNITLASSQENATLIDGETGVYSYTVTVNESAPATEPSITTQPQDATYIIGSTDYPSMSVAATASAGELEYKWHIIIPSVGDIAIPGATTNSLSLADYKDMMAAYLTSPAEYDIYCVVKDDNASVNTNTAKIIVKEAADPVGGVTITEEPSDVTYTIGDADYPSMSVQATAATGEITYDWQYSTDGEIFVSLASMVPSASTATLSGAEVIAALGNMIPEGQIPAGTYYVKCTLNNEGVGTDTRIASLTVKAAEPVGPPATPTFSLPAGSTIKAGEPVVITSDDGSQIYYNWSGKATGGYDEAALLKRTPKDSPASCTTSTTGNRYLYALAKRGDATSEIAIIGYTVEPNPVKGQLDKTADVVDQYADAPAVPVFSLVDADGNPSPASMGAEGSTKDIFVKYVVSGTDGIITLNSDATAIESINTATAGTATATITIKKNKDGYPLIDGEGTYEYTITVNGGSTPATGLVINTQPKNVTYTIGDTDYPSVSVEATAATGEITYDWKFSLNGNDFTSLTTMSITSASTNTLSGEEVFNVLAHGGEIPTGTYYLRCTLTNGDYSVETNTATITVNKPAELTPVSASTTWDFTDVTWDGTTNKNDNDDYELVGDDRTTEYAYKDVSGLTFANTFNANAIAFKGQYPIRSNSKKHAQNGVVRIATSCPGTIKVSFTDTGTKATTDAVKRYLVVNGEQTEYWTSRENNGAEPYDAQLNVTTGEINVVAGNITIEGTSAICVSKIVFTANATAINGIAEDTVDAKNANVKVIKNGKLYIGKYNVAGQRVK